MMEKNTTYEPDDTNPVSRRARKYIIRRWSVRHARGLEWFYDIFSNILFALHPLFKMIGYERAEAPVAVLERAVKGFLFDCRMCGQCVLSSTGMSCPMHCPKTLLNGPCGGVLENGNCEVEPDMPCVWIEAWKGSVMMKNGGRIEDVQIPHDERLRGTSSWLRVTGERARESQL